MLNVATNITDALLNQRRQFAEVWARLAQEGRCDDVGGAEYRRVLLEWLNRCSAEEMERFIVERANISSTGHT